MKKSIWQIKVYDIDFAILTNHFVSKSTPFPLCSRCISAPVYNPFLILWHSKSVVYYRVACGKSYFRLLQRIQRSTLRSLTYLTYFKENTVSLNIYFGPFDGIIQRLISSGHLCLKCINEIVEAQSSHLKVRMKYESIITCSNFPPLAKKYMNLCWLYARILQ